MASTDTLCLLCIILVSRVGFGACRAADASKDGGAQPELFIFHESCALKRDEGPCKALLDRFYFDIDSGRCEPFEYGGCKGNANNFESLEACSEMCVVSAEKSPCHLSEAPGPCRGLVTRFFYDGESQTCKRFFYGGCFGNANNFRSLRDCQARCHGNPGTTTEPQVEINTQPPTSKPSVGPQVTGDLALSEAQVSLNHRLPIDVFSPPDVCLRPAEKGPCDRVDRRFAYNPKTRRCHSFKYSGCGGNNNNFVLRRHCIKMCMETRGTREGKIVRIKKKTGNIVFHSV